MRFSTALLLLLLASTAAAQTRPTGYVSTFVDFFPNREDATELRARVFAEQKLEPSEHVRFTLSGFAEGLVARRPHAGNEPGRARVTDAMARAQEAAVLVRAGRLDLYAGYGQVAWGRLDELQPTDVINPLDVSRFFFEGRSEARLPVSIVRARFYVTADISFEAVYVPVFRRGRFDQLDEPSAPFNIVADAVGSGPCVPPSCTAPAFGPEVREPATSWRNGQGGARFSATTGRVDWSVSAYRGFEAFGLFRGRSGVLVPIEERFPRFTMGGADFETVLGPWGIRGEVAAFLRDSFQAERPLPSIVSGKSLEGGIGVDRKTGDYRISGTVLLRREIYDVPLLTAEAASDRLVVEDSRTDLTLIASADRTFARDKYNLRMFGVYGATEGSAFIRGILTAKLRDEVALEGSTGWFVGGGRDLVGRFEDCDFVYARLKLYF